MHRLNMNFCRTLSTIAIVTAWIMSTPVNASEQALPDASIPELSALFGGEFTLIDQDGVTRTDQDFRGKYLLVNFGYTNCPGICPTDLAIIATTVDLLEQEGGCVQPVFITVDPVRDTPERLKSYLARFHPRLIGLTGHEEQIRVAAKAYRVHRMKVIVDDNPVDNYLASHSSLTYLMDPDGNFLTIFPHDTAPQFMADTVHRHMRQPCFGG